MMPRDKKVKLSELDDIQLILQFQIATRKSWEIFLKQPQKVALKSPERREEQRIKRELMRRLIQKENIEASSVHNESQRDMRLRMGF